MTQEDIINIIAMRSSDETPNINIECIEPTHEDCAALVKFTFGEYDDVCYAVVYDEGEVFTPYDWYDPQLTADKMDTEGIDWIENIDWVYGEYGNERRAIVLNGLPRRFF